FFFATSNAFLGRSGSLAFSGLMTISAVASTNTFSSGRSGSRSWAAVGRAAAASASAATHKERAIGRSSGLWGASGRTDQADQEQDQPDREVDRLEAGV